MTPSAPSSKLPAWIFYATDLVLLAAAVSVAALAPRPLPNSAIFGIVACVIAGAIVAIIPRLVEYEREKNEALDERQRALEALAGTIAGSAEQISVAASGLHGIAELTQKNLRHADQLPHKLQEKIAEFQAQLANADNVEKEELENELVALRSSESERLESIADRIAKSVAELARLETSLQKQFVAAQIALHKVHSEPPLPTEEKLRDPLAALSAQLASVSVPGSNTPAIARPVPTLPTSSPFLKIVGEKNSPAPDVNSSPPAPASDPEAKAEAVAHPPRRPRKPRREETPPGVLLSSAVTSVATAPAFPIEEPPPVTPLEITPIAPDSKSPYAIPLANDALATAADETLLSTAVAKSPRKRVDKKSSAPDGDNALGLEIAPEPSSVGDSPTAFSVPSEFNQISPEESVRAAIAADGATRLLVTAYIGIGNRLFIRGEGPGLTWEKGVPLQFVSIGKWRWETAEAAEPVKFKLYKNDELECAGVGLQTLAAGHQQELTAAF